MIRRAAPFLLSLAGCLGPMADDTPGWSPNVLAPGTEVSNLADDPVLRNRVDSLDAVDGDFVPLLPGFANGEAVSYWDFGPSVSFAIPVYLIRRCTSDGFLPVGEGGVNHTNMIDSVPGDPSYSPLWTMTLVCVTDEYGGEVFPSLAAVEDAQAMGLVEAPVPLGMWANCPVVLPGTQLDLGEGLEPLLPHDGFYNGYGTNYFHLGGMDHGVFPYPDDRALEANFAYEIVTASGNRAGPTVFSVGRRIGDENDPEYTPLWNVVRVQVDATYGGTVAQSESELVRVNGDEFEPVHPAIISMEILEGQQNLSIQFQTGHQ